MLKRLRNLTAPPAAEQRAALLAGKHITYTLKRSSKRRSIGLRVDDRGLVVSVPVRASESWLQSVLEDKAVWVLEKLDQWKVSQPVEALWEDGEGIAFLGELLTLRVVQGLFAAPPAQIGSELWVFVAGGGEPGQVKQAVSRWYRHAAGQLFADRVAHYTTLLQVAPREIKLSSAKTQWGSCTVSGTVYLNVQLIKLPMHLVDYVVVHELAHLRELNHSASFWRLVESIFPDYAMLRSELKAVALR